MQLNPFKIAENQFKYLMEKIWPFLCAKPLFKKYNEFLILLGMKGLGILNWENNTISGEHWLLRKFLKKYFKHKKNLTFFDVGANIGIYSKHLKEIFPQAKIYTFEPHPKTFIKLKENLKHSDCFLYNIGLSDSSCELEIFDYLDEENGSSHASLYYQAFSEIYKQNCIKTKISVNTLDTICHENNIKKIDFLKIDVEGHEINVLKGAKEFIDNNQIDLILFEFNNLNLYSKTTMNDFFSLFPQSHFFRLLPKGLIKLDKNNHLLNNLFSYQNILIMNNPL